MKTKIFFLLFLFFLLFGSCNISVYRFKERYQFTYLKPTVRNLYKTEGTKNIHTYYRYSFQKYHEIKSLIKSKKTPKITDFDTTLLDKNNKFWNPTILQYYEKEDSIGWFFKAEKWISLYKYSKDSSHIVELLECPQTLINFVIIYNKKGRLSSVKKYYSKILLKENKYDNFNNLIYDTTYFTNKQLHELKKSIRIYLNRNPNFINQSIFTPFSKDSLSNLKFLPDLIITKNTDDNSINVFEGDLGYWSLFPNYLCYILDPISFKIMNKSYIYKPPIYRE